MAYMDLLPELGHRQLEVYKIITGNPGISDLEISKHLMLPINSVTPRRKELVNLGVIVECCKKIGLTGRTVMGWEVAR